MVVLYYFGRGWDFGFAKELSFAGVGIFFKRFLCFDGFGVFIKIVAFSEGPLSLAKDHFFPISRISFPGSCKLDFEIVFIFVLYFRDECLHNNIMSCLGSFDSMCKRIICPARHTHFN